MRQGPGFGLTSVLLGPPGRQRVRVLQTLLGMPALALVQCLLLVEHWQLQTPWAPLVWYAALSWLGCAVFYGLVRSGLSERLSAEPSLSLPQMLYAMACVAWAHWLAGPMRDSLLMLVPLVLCFGVFALDDRRLRELAALGTLGMGLVMVLRALAHEAGGAALQDLSAWLFLAVANTSIAILGRRMARMRERLQAQKASLNEALAQIRLLATRDTLTGLLNRRAMQEQVAPLVQQATRQQRPLTLALADLDHFKLINDHHGHAAGDRVLQAFARVAERELRGADRVARWGGEEFLFALPDTDEVQAHACLERLREALRRVVVEALPAGTVISFSAGITRCGGLEDLEHAIERADMAMYRAKLEGRGRTSLASEDDVERCAAARRQVAAEVPA